MSGDHIYYLTQPEYEGLIRSLESMGNQVIKLEARIKELEKDKADKDKASIKRFLNTGEF